MTDKPDFYGNAGLLREKFTAVLKKFFCDKFFAREKNPTTKGSLVAKIPLVTKTPPQEKSRRNENSANNIIDNIIDNKILPTTKRASSEAL